LKYSLIGRMLQSNCYPRRMETTSDRLESNPDLWKDRQTLWLVNHSHRLISQ